MSSVEHSYTGDGKPDVVIITRADDSKEVMDHEYHPDRGWLCP